ncbi:hypothetical protein M2447_001066 [Ereboglobus sp. PH5-10]|uniref:Sb-PDE family phosphodiesterase n=1 Tax=Ereboglobus sp. PH5-10 TaxID=2940629 RepID=UPI002406F8FF|nr:Sb-PDE family phosphodiesterase [Ereboglobus sp. PH5-10]MDF9826981.1 hypothetical protein [Ereboglobus sp. PH5-10]
MKKHHHHHLRHCSLFAMLFALALGTLHAQHDPFRVEIPDIPGYKTLRCDLHMHTVFSDGQVWPAVRASEASREGLAAIAMTDHQERRRNVYDEKVSRNYSFEIASKAAPKNLVVIPGTEVTYGMPPGHFNAIFIKDADAMSTTDWRKALEEAKKQGAFITWNHPRWENQQAHITRWLPEHEEIFQNGWMQGIEVANGSLYSPHAFQWALDKKLTMIGASDVHAPIQTGYDFHKGEHRTSTLVFAKEATAASIREALDNRRTAVYFREFVYGEEQWLRPLVEACLSVKVAHNVGSNTQTPRFVVTIKNNSGLTFKLLKVVPGEKPAFYRDYLVKPHSSRGIGVGFPDEIGSDEVVFQVSNFLTSPETPLTFTVKLPKTPKDKRVKSKAKAK